MLDKIFIQRSYANIVGKQLQGFNVQSLSPYKANFRCPICGDSHKNKFKKRAYFIERENNLMFYCHNQCGGMSFEHFLRDYYNDIYNEYHFDIIRQWQRDREIERKQDSDEGDVLTLPKVEIKQHTTVTNDIEQLFKQNCITTRGEQYLTDRKIDKKFWNDIFETNHFYRFINQIVPNKFNYNLVQRIDHRIMLPMRDYDRKIFGVVGRALDKSNKVRYLTIKFDDNHVKIFGLDRLDKSKLGYIVEGPIDSLFIDNCIAFAGTDGNPLSVFNNKNQCVIILDNQPRSRDVIKKYEKYINEGYSMVIWPELLLEKDINDIILSGISREQLGDLIRSRTFSGLRLQIEFNSWKKV